MIEINENAMEKMSNYVWDDVSRNWLREMLKNQIVNIKFKKRNGQIRVINATTNEKLIASIKNEIFKNSDEYIRVTDTEINEWRTIRFDSIMEIKISLE
jgi:acylphosphatase